MTAPSQLTLAVALQDDARFENFYCGEANQQLVSTLKRTDSQSRLIYLYGRKSSGKSHLLQALCHQAQEQGRPSIFFNLADAISMPAEILQELDVLSLICIDDFEEINQLPGWELGFFNLFNRVRETGGELIITANAPPANLSIELSDLQSRLQSMLIYRLYGLDDEEKKRALQLRAEKRGYLLSDPVVDFIMLRAGRDFAELIGVLDTLDSKTLEKKRMLTIPLVKDTLGW